MQPDDDRLRVVRHVDGDGRSAERVPGFTSDADAPPDGARDDGRMIAVPVLAQSFGFVNPAIAAAAGAAALVPIVVHLLNRRRHKRVVWAAMVFLLAATRQSRRRLFVEQWLLLALRVVLIGLGVAAAGRPFLS
ncbi:MAG: hypothetical protein F9K17_14765, partial [Phycisphaerae bacterium]